MRSDGMEHIFFFGVIEYFRLRRKPLHEAYPDLPRLLAEPQRVLAQQPVQIGPGASRLEVLVVTLAATIGVCLGVGGLLAEAFLSPNPDPLVQDLTRQPVVVLVAGT